MDWKSVLQDLIMSFLDKKKHIPDWLGDGESWDVGTGGQNSWHRLVRSAAVQVCGVKPSPERGNQLAQTVVEKTILYVMCTYNTIYIYIIIYILTSKQQGMFNLPALFFGGCKQALPWDDIIVLDDFLVNVSWTWHGTTFRSLLCESPAAWNGAQ